MEGILGRMMSQQTGVESYFFEGIDKFTILSSSQLRYFGAWLEQLIAESTGKNGKGILPVDLEPMSSIENFPRNRVFVQLKLEGDSFNDEIINVIKEKDFPFIEITLNDVYDLAGEIFRWEFATSIAGVRIYSTDFEKIYKKIKSLIPKYIS